ncbi:MAG: 50S ribosomal protein L4 [Bacteroidota bacterium]
MEIEVYNISGTKTAKKINLDDSIYAIEPNDHAIYLDVKQYMAGQRQGTHKSKERWEISGSTKKIKRQKGTGGARAGDINSPIFKGGGRAFGPRPRDYNFKLNKKVKRLARKSALSYKIKENGLLIVEDFSFEEPRTKNYSELLKNLNLTGKKTLLVLSESNRNVLLSARNLKKTKVITSSNLNTYDILNANNLLLVESSVKELDKMFNISDND